jgi:transposase
MSASKHLREPILKLRGEGKSYRQIEKILKCSRGSVHYHCDNNGLTDTGKKRFPINAETKKEIYEYCKTHSDAEAMNHFSKSLSTIQKYKKGEKTK